MGGGLLISIHQNCFPTSQPSGAQVLYAPGEESRRLGELTQGDIVSSLQPENRRVAEPASPGLYLTTHVSCPMVLVECGFSVQSERSAKALPGRIPELACRNAALRLPAVYQ